MHLFGQLAVATSLLATIASTFSVYPHQLAYFNEVAGGPENGYKHLLHSNVDWGQDLLLVKDWMNDTELQRKEVRIETYYPYPAAILISDIAASCDEWKWVVVSSNNIVTTGKANLRDPMSTRIGYSLWLCPCRPTTAGPGD